MTFLKNFASQVVLGKKYILLSYKVADSPSNYSLLAVKKNKKINIR